MPIVRFDVYFHYIDNTFICVASLGDQNELSKAKDKKVSSKAILNVNFSTLYIDQLITPLGSGPSLQEPSVPFVPPSLRLPSLARAPHFKNPPSHSSLPPTLPQITPLGSGPSLREPSIPFVPPSLRLPRLARAPSPQEPSVPFVPPSLPQITPLGSGPSLQEPSVPFVPPSLPQITPLGSGPLPSRTLRPIRPSLRLPRSARAPPFKNPPSHSSLPPSLPQITPLGSGPSLQEPSVPFVPPSDYPAWLGPLPSRTLRPIRPSLPPSDYSALPGRFTL